MGGTGAWGHMVGPHGGPRGMGLEDPGPRGMGLKDPWASRTHEPQGPGDP